MEQTKGKESQVAWKKGLQVIEVLVTKKQRKHSKKKKKTILLFKSGII